jgi:thioredoxin 1
MKKLLRFTASWCGPCKSLAATMGGMDLGMPVEVIDIDESQELAKQYNIRGVPTLIILEDDVEVKRTAGTKTAQQLTEWVA